jgi:tetratricopeptide (TPR) repeat protein
MTSTDETSLTLSQATDLHRAGDLPAAASAYAHLLEQEPRNHDARYGLGTVHMQQGDLGSAKNLLKEAVRAAPGVPEYRFNYGCVLEKLDQHFAAVEQFEIASRQQADSKVIWIALARALGNICHYPAAIRAQEHALGLGTATDAEFLKYADLLFMARRPDDARRAIDKARQLSTADPRSFFLEARCERIAGNSDTERQLLQKAIDLRPGYGEAWQFLLELTPDDQLQAVADDCDNLARDVATSPRDKLLLRFTTGRAYERLGQYELAFEQFADANRRQRADAEAREKGYDRSANEQYLDWVRQEFDGRGSQASSTPVDEQPIFVLGLPRSGTTLVECILGGLDGVTPGGESEALEFVTTQYYNAMASGQSPAIRQLEPRHWDELADYYWRVQTSKKCHLTDKMPSNIRHVGMLCQMFPDAPVIFVRRDPRDIAVSIYSRMFPDGHAYATDLENIAHYHSFADKLLAHWQHAYTDRIFVVDYEALVADPERQSRRLAEFCGLEWQASCLNFHERQHANYTFSELQVREPLNTKGVGRWRNYEQALAPFIDACIAYGVRLRDN